jgi:L-seryl-tRNA(Ser) seleniumtransferase
VCFSGDKLLGGPQAGIVIGRADLVAELRRHPLARAVRLDKMSLAALDWTCATLLAGELERIPALRQLLLPEDAVAARAEALAAQLAPLAAAAGAQLSLQASRVPVGGGSLPGFELPSRAVALRAAGVGADALAARLRRAPVPVVARVEDGAVLLDARTLSSDDLPAVAAAFAQAFGAPHGAGRDGAERHGASAREDAD